MKVVIVGAGAIGLLLYQGLQQNRQLKNGKNALTLLSKTPLPAFFTFTNLQHYSKQVPLFTANTQDITEADLIVVCVKAYQVKQVIEQLTPYLAANTAILFTNNGLGVIDEIPNDLRAKHPLLTALITHGSRKLTPLHILHTGDGVIELGSLNPSNFDKALNNKVAQTCLKYFQQGFNNSYWQDDIVIKQWRKLAVNCVINPLTAINKINNGKVLLPQYQEIILAVLQELIEVAKNQGLHFNLNELTDLVRQVAKTTENNYSSMYSDVLKQQPTEIDYINGYLVKLGEQFGIKTPMNLSLWQQVKQLVP